LQKPDQFQGPPAPLLPCAFPKNGYDGPGKSGRHKVFHIQDHMQISKDTLAGRTIVAVVYVAVIALLAAGILLGVWTAREMNAVVTDQFNAQQMVIAQTAKARIEREIGEVKHELFFQAQALRGKTANARELSDALRQGLVRLSESGVRKVEIVDRTAHTVFTVGLHGSWSERSLAGTDLYDAVRFTSREEPAFWVSPVSADAAGEEMMIAARLIPDAGRLLVFHINVSAGGPIHLPPEPGLFRPRRLCGSRGKIP
jgi:hypothetical protein